MILMLCEAIAKHGASHNIKITEETTPYFYRYFCDYLAKNDDSAAIVESVLAAERQMLAASAMAPLGWRLAATRA